MEQTALHMIAGVLIQELMRGFLDAMIRSRQAVPKKSEDGPPQLRIDTNNLSWEKLSLYLYICVTELFIVALGGGMPLQLL